MIFLNLLVTTSLLSCHVSEHKFVKPLPEDERLILKSTQLTSPRPCRVGVEFSEYSLRLQGLDQYLTESGHSVTEGYSGQIELQIRVYSRVFSSAKSVAEIGFNAGHSAMIMLVSGCERVVEFDIGGHSYTAPAFEHLKFLFPDRELRMILGDSGVTVPQYHAENPDTKFDVVIVDGGHAHEQAVKDITSMGKLARRDTVLIIDDTPCGESFCVTGAVDECVARGMIVVTDRFAHSRGRGFTLAKYT